MALLASTSYSKTTQQRRPYYGSNGRRDQPARGDKSPFIPVSPNGRPAQFALPSQSRHSRRAVEPLNGNCFHKDLSVSPCCFRASENSYCTQMPAGSISPTRLGMTHFRILHPINFVANANIAADSPWQQASGQCGETHP